MRAVELILKRLWPEELAIQGESAVELRIADYTGVHWEELARLERERVASGKEPLALPAKAEVVEVEVEAVAEKEAEPVKPEPETWSISRPWEDEWPSHAETDD